MEYKKFADLPRHIFELASQNKCLGVHFNETIIIKRSWCDKSYSL